MVNFQNWNEWRNSVNEEDFFLPKEDGELLNSYLEVKDFNAHKNFLEWFENLEPCKIGKFITIRKVGQQLLTNQKQRLDAINRSQEAYVDWLKAQVQGLAQISANFKDLPTVDVKQAAIAVILETQIVTQITRLGTQTTLLEEELERGHFCLECCNTQGEGF